MLSGHGSAWRRRGNSRAARIAVPLAIPMALGRRKFLPPFATWYAANLFAIVPLRNILPGAPPPGSWIDQAIVQWVLIALVTQVIGSSVARAFSLVGALAIVRFRTLVEDMRDTTFVIAAVAVGMEVGVPDAAIVRALAEFKGVGRRFQRYGDIALPAGGRATLIDDYGHHPVEMAATLAGNSRRNASATLTAGLKCAPDMGPKVRMSTVKIAPVGIVLQRSASAPLPPASFAAMMPEPTTPASKNAVPKHSATLRCANDGI